MFIEKNLSPDNNIEPFHVDPNNSKYETSKVSHETNLHIAHFQNQISEKKLIKINRMPIKIV